MTIFYSGLQTGRHEKGVEFVIDNLITSRIKIFLAVNHRLCYTRISNQNLDLFILNCYAPTEEAGEEEKNTFYDNLERTFDSLSYCIKLIVGDKNAQIDREPVFRSIICQSII